MAADSLIGGDEVVSKLPTTVVATLNTILNDTQAGTITTSVSGGSTIVSGLGANNERQTVIVPVAKPLPGLPVPSPNLVTVNDGLFNSLITLPVGMGLSTEGPSTTVFGSTGGTYLKGLTQNAILPSGGTPPTTAALKVQSSIDSAVNKVLRASDTTINHVVRVVNIIKDKADTDGGDVVLTGDANKPAGQVEVLAVNMNKLNANNTLIVNNVEKLVLVGAGNVKANSTKAITIVGDVRAQSIAGGAGDDTLSGGGGSDTLSGGAGNNTFGVTGGGDSQTKLTITDFDATKDKLSIDVPGVTNFADLKGSLASATFVDGNMHFTLNDGSEITLLGVNPSQITADLFDFGS